MTAAVAKRNEIEPANETTATIQMIERLALNPNVNVETIERLLAMQEKVLARNARTAFMAALAEMQTELPAIEQRGKIKISQSNVQKYALWEDINDAIKPVMHKHGFALSFRCGQSEGKISVTGVLSHREGHSEETTMHLPIDTSGSKNAVQAVGSSTSYGKRYTAQALLNLTSRGEDDDGKAAGGGFINDAQMKELKSALKEADLEESNEAFLNFVGAAKIEDFTKAHFDKAMAALKARKAAKK